MQEDNKRETLEDLVNEIETTVTKHLETFSRYSVTLTDEQKANAPGIVAQLHHYLNKLPADMRSKELASRLEYNDLLEVARKLFKKLVESILEAQLANRADNTGMVDTFRANLLIIRRSLADLDTAMKDIVDWNARNGNGRHDIPDSTGS